MDTELDSPLLIEMAQKISLSKLDLAGSTNVKIDEVEALAAAMVEKAKVGTIPQLILPASLAHHADLLKKKFPQLDFLLVDQGS